MFLSKSENYYLENFYVTVLNHGFPHPTILLHGIGAGDLEIDLSDQKKNNGRAGGMK